MKPIHQMTGTDILNLLKSLDKKTWIKIGSAAAGLLLLTYFILWPAWFKRTEVKGKIAAIEGQIVRLQTHRRNEKTWLEQKQQYTEFIKSVKERLYAPRETSLLLGQISKMANDSGVSIIASTPQANEIKFPKPFDETYKPELYDFTVEGDYHELGIFLSKIESGSKILRVEYFQLMPTEKNSEVHTATLTLSAVSLKQGQGASA